MRVQGSGFRVQGSGSGLRVEGSGFSNLRSSLDGLRQESCHRRQRRVELLRQGAPYILINLVLINHWAKRFALGMPNIGHAKCKLLAATVCTGRSQQFVNMYRRERRVELLRQGAPPIYLHIGRAQCTILRPEVCSGHAQYWACPVHTFWTRLY